MAYDYYQRVLCPFCRSGEMRAVNAGLARCTGCDDTMSRGFYDTLLQIRALEDAESEHEGPKMGDVPGATYRGDEAVPDSP